VFITRERARVEPTTKLSKKTKNKAFIGAILFIHFVDFNFFKSFLSFIFNITFLI